MLATEHVAQFYEDDNFLLGSITKYIASALLAGDAGIVVATKAHRDELEDRLTAQGIDLASARTSGRYISFDAFELLSTFMVEGMPDPHQFTETFKPILTQASDDQRKVYIYAEMAPLIAAEGQQAAAIRLEALWNEFQETYSFSLFCGYSLNHLGETPEVTARMLRDVCNEHSHIVPAESFTSLSSEQDRLREIAALQQKATWLETEIAERKNAQEQLQRALESERAARQAAEEALRTRDNFIMAASHELKTPVTSMMGYAQLVMRRLARNGDKAVPTWINESLQAVTSQASKLSHLIEQLLDITRVDSHTLPLDWQATNLTGLIEQTIAHTYHEHHTIIVDAPESLVIQADPLRLEQVLINLLNNAVKYSPKGATIEIALSEMHGSQVKLSVRDHGPGITPDQRKRMFERFYRTNNNDVSSGMGLGLHISRQIIELHGGVIDAEFPDDGGTRIVIQLPVDQPLSDASATKSMRHRYAPADD